MKRLLLMYAALLCTICVFGQAQDGIVVYNKTHQPAALINLPYATDVVNAAMDDYLSQKGSKSSEIKGFKTFRNTQLVQGDSVNADLYFKVTRKSRKEKDASIVYLMIGMPNEDIAARSPETHFNSEQAKQYLNKLVPVIAAYSLEGNIKLQNEIVIKEEKKYRSLQEEGNDLNKSKMDIERKIADNKRDQEKQSAAIEKQKQELAILVSQRKL